MGLGARVHNHKAKLKKDTNHDTFRPMQNPGTPKDHRSINMILGHARKIIYVMLKIFSESRTRTIRNYKTETLSNKNILWLYRYKKMDVIHVISKHPEIMNMYNVTI